MPPTSRPRSPKPSCSAASSLSNIFSNAFRRTPPGLHRLNADPRLRAQVLDLFEHSPYFAEELIRTPELLDEIAADFARRRLRRPTIASELRRWYRREMVRIQAASICLSEPIFDTLVRTSELADAVIARVYDIAIAEARASHPPPNPRPSPLESDVGDRTGPPGHARVRSGAPTPTWFSCWQTPTPHDLAFWTRVAERVSLISLPPTPAAASCSPSTRVCGPTAATVRWC